MRLRFSSRQHNASDIFQHMFSPRGTSFSLLLLFSLALFSLIAGSAPRAEAETGDLVQNADFESGNLSSWITYFAPGGSGNTGVTNDTCCNHTPGGHWSGYIKPQTGFIEIYQNIPVTPGKIEPGKSYYLLAWISTNGMTAKLQWWTDVGGQQTCATIPLTILSWDDFYCRITIPAGTTKFAVVFGADAAPGKSAIIDDIYLTPVKLHNAIQKNDGNYYGSSAHIEWTNPDLRNGNWVYNRTIVGHHNPGTCSRFSEIGWRKDKIFGLQILIVWDSGCFRQEKTFPLTTGTHTFGQLYDLGDDGRDHYAWFVDGVYYDNGITNFSYSTWIECGGEVEGGIENMGNTRCYQNEKATLPGLTSFGIIPWGSHIPRVQDAPYRNTNDSSDPANSFYSTGPLDGE